MYRASIWSIVVLAGLVAGCSAVEMGSASEAASLAASADSASSGPPTSAVERQPLPTGFPVLAGAVAVAMPDDDTGLIGLWESDRVGSAAYDFYAEALLTAGYPIVGLYPGGDVALIRFQATNGAVWQLIAHTSADGGTSVEVRLDRP